MSQYNVLLICGGGSDEHEISLISAKFIQSQLAKFSQINLIQLILDKQGSYSDENGSEYYFSPDGKLHKKGQQNENIAIDFVIPCFHGFPGETGDIQSFLRLNNLKFLGSDAEASGNCFNKVTAKQWLTALGIPNTPYLFLSEYKDESIFQAQQALQEWGSIFIKSASQGSSVGCYKVNLAEEVADKLKLAFQFSPYVLVEKTMQSRELEVSVYEYNNEVIVTKPGEIICDEGTFYDYDEKYSQSSKARTEVVANDIDEEILRKIIKYGRKAFIGMKLRHLARVDFFLTTDNELLVNEINSFPGMTPISMFPQMLINNGHDFGEFILQVITKETVK